MKLFYGFIIGVIFVFYLLDIRNNCYLSGDSHKLLIKIIQKLTRQAARWSTAAAQDENSMIAVLHANYGAGYLWALKDIASDKQIEMATGLNAKKFENEIVKTQDTVTTQMARYCPKYAPKSTYLTRAGGEGI